MTSSAAAELDRLLRELLPASVAHASGSIDAATGAIDPAEEALVARAVAKRQAEFRAGRLLARRALAALGARAEPLLIGEGRQPLWPEGFRGSITHSGDLAAAAVAATGALPALGLDLETTIELKPKLWRMILTPPEKARLELLDQARRAAEAMVVFSAKEAFFKCQYPLTGLWLNFDAVTLALDPERETFTVLSDREELRPFFAAHAVQGHYRQRPDFVLSACLAHRP